MCAEQHGSYTSESLDVPQHLHFASRCVAKQTCRPTTSPHDEPVDHNIITRNVLQPAINTNILSIKTVVPAAL